MEAKLLGTLAQLLGVTGAAIAVFYLLYKQIIDKVKLPGLTRRQSFVLILVLMAAIWSFAIFVILGSSDWQVGSLNIRIDGDANNVSS